MGRFHPANLRAAAWAFRTARRARLLLNKRGLDAALAPLPPPPPLPPEAERGVRAVLRRRQETCLVNSIVLQAWEAAHGRRRDLVVGVTGPDRFRAHAWLEGDAVPTVDDEAIAVSMLDSRLSNRLPVSGQRLNGSGATGGDRANATTATFTEILRRPAPRYGGVPSSQSR